MAKPNNPVAVLTADVIKSTAYGNIQRRHVDRVLLKSFDQVVRRYSKAVHTPLGFRITAGDEFQCVFSDVSKTIEILMFLRALAATSKVRPIIQFRAAIGVGEISVTKRTNPYEEDGEAFVRARWGLERLEKRSADRTRIVTGQGEVDEMANTLLVFMDDLQKGWTLPQWEAVKWSMLGLTREEMGRKLMVAHQNITKRLMAARWPQFKAGLTFLTELLAKAVNEDPKMRKG